MRIDRPDPFDESSKKPNRGRGPRAGRRKPEPVRTLRQAFRRPAPPGPIESEPDWRAYGPVAPDYARVMAPRTALVAADLVDLAGVEPGNRVLDVGTGTGVVAAAAADRAGNEGLAVGVDISLDMLRAGRGEGRARFVQAAAIDLPFRDGTFHVVTASFVLTHFPRYETALFDMLRVLTTRGRLAVTSWGPTMDEFTRTWEDLAEQFAGREMFRDAHRRAMPWSERFSDPGRLSEALYDAGVRELRAERKTYHFHMTAQDYLVSREITATGRFLQQMLGERLWDRFQARTREVFAERFPTAFNDFRDAVLAVGRKP